MKKTIKVVIICIILISCIIIGVNAQKSVEKMEEKKIDSQINISEEIIPEEKIEEKKIDSQINISEEIIPEEKVESEDR